MEESNFAQRNFIICLRGSCLENNVPEMSENFSSSTLRYELSIIEKRF